MSARLVKNIQTDFNKFFQKHGAQPKNQVIRFWQQSGLGNFQRIYIANCIASSIRQMAPLVSAVVCSPWVLQLSRSQQLRKRRRYCDTRHLCVCVCVSAEPRLHAVLVLVAKVMRCILCIIIIQNCQSSTATSRLNVVKQQTNRVRWRLRRSGYDFQKSQLLKCVLLRRILELTNYQRQNLRVHKEISSCRSILWSTY